jgi:hypothetical protein
MKNRNIILTAILSLLGCGGLSYTARAAAPVDVVNTPNVNVVNPTTNPVPVIGTVQNAENPARNAVQAFFTVTLTGGLPSGDSSISVPAGKIFVIEFASLSGSVRGGTVSSLAIEVFENFVTGGANGALYELVIPPPDSNGFIHGSQTVRLYAPGSHDLAVHFAVIGFDPNNPPSVTVLLSGYFVSAQ